MNSDNWEEEEEETREKRKKKKGPSGLNFGLTFFNFSFVLFNLLFNVAL